MDSSTVEHSDSDSGESWTLLENTPAYADDAPDSENTANEGARAHVDFHSDKDEDTDGISIISDSEPESAPCDLNYVRLPAEEYPTEQQNFTLLPSLPTINNHNNEPIREEPDFLGDNVKYKTYVHKRNPKVGTILDVIMLGTFVITAGMALGHLWSCKNECTTQTSVNKVLSNLYKLQEENAFLRSKLKEITEANSYLPKPANKPNKQLRCKKIFEEPILRDNKLKTATKCVEDKKPNVLLYNSPVIPEHEKEFLNDIGKMKVIYEKNKIWLDKQIKRQFDDFKKIKENKQNMESNSEEQQGPVSFSLNQPDLIQDIITEPENVERHSQNNLEKEPGSKYYQIPKNKQGQIQDSKTNSNAVKTDKKIIKTHRQIGLEKQLGSEYYQIPEKKQAQIQDPKTDSSTVNTDKEIILELQSGSSDDTNVQSELSEKKISYADSLKIEQPLHRDKRNVNNELPSRFIKDHKKKIKKDDLFRSLLSAVSEDDLKKDDRYTGPKLKNEKKKYDRQKSHKKQKRNNKYEQWEMKGGYLKDFDEFSITSSQNNISLNKPEKKFMNTDFENYVNKLIEAENNASNRDLPKITKNTGERQNKSENQLLKGDKRKRGKTKDFDWYDQRTALRAEARAKLEQELFGENTSNNAAWYFRRMQKREQCRAQKDNSTFKKFYKRKLNFKMKR